MLYAVTEGGDKIEGFSLRQRWKEGEGKRASRRLAGGLTGGVDGAEYLLDEVGMDLSPCGGYYIGAFGWLVWVGG